MPNRAERRTASRRRGSGIPVQYDRTRGRSRSKMLDEDALQERSRRLVEHGDVEWKPRASTTSTDADEARTEHPEVHTGIGGVRGVLRLVSWTVIGLSVLAFFILMWLPTHPFALVAGVSIAFGVGVLSLFVVSSGGHDNPVLDEHGTAL